MENTLGDILEQNEKKQLRISETEKYAHVTFFFDGGVKKEHRGKENILINSPDVATYDLKPEMSSEELTSRVIEEIKKDKFDFILLNYPNADMVGHSGQVQATIKAIEAVDRSVKRVIDEALAKDYLIILTADHGNAEEVGESMTSHTSNLVPTTFIAKELKGLRKEDFLKEGNFGIGSLGRTILDLMKIKNSQLTDLAESILKKDEEEK